MRRLFGRSLKLRQVSAGGCNGCEAELNVLGHVVFDLGRFGIQFVASPRHADGIVVTGPVTRNMQRALRETWEAVPAPRLVIAVGACAISGGPFRGSRPPPTASRRSSRSTSTSPAARRTRSPSSTGCCGCWASCDRRPAHRRGGAHGVERDLGPGPAAAAGAGAAAGHRRPLRRGGPRRGRRGRGALRGQPPRADAPLGGAGRGLRPPRSTGSPPSSCCRS